MKNITHIVVHYSATYDDQEVTRNDVDAWHRARGWKNGIGYHFFYRLNGMEEIGRPVTVTGAHVGNKNRNKIGLCFAGGTKRETGPNVGINTLNLAQEKALIHRIRLLKSAWPKAEVVGHKDLAKTQCPGFDVKDWWAKVEANNYQPVFNTPKKAETFTDKIKRLMSKGKEYVWR